MHLSVLGRLAAIAAAAGLLLALERSQERVAELVVALYAPARPPAPPKRPSCLEVEKLDPRIRGG